MHTISLGELLPIWSIVPFVGLLLSIAIIPLMNAHFWERHMFKVVILWSLAFLIPFAFAFGKDIFLEHLFETVILDYLPFMVLLFGLFAVSGGIVLRGNLAGTPKVNTVLLLLGTLLASWVGTTGASMLLIRPLIKANRHRQNKVHIIIFFIFLVSNIGGSLTPLGDPPLFMGFLRGVPFFWTMELLPLMLFNTLVLLIIFYVVDSFLYKRETLHTKKDVAHESLRIGGALNLIFILMIVGAVIISGVVPKHGTIIQVVIILLAALLSILTTKKSVREENFFTWAPIKEVAQLFIGIFITMIPALALLSTHGAELGLNSAAHFFWASGLLSGFLDNTPTYLVFLTAAASIGTTEGIGTTLGIVAPQLLLAISAGSVFMGANTYIGNAPNFMVKSIAEENRIKMPGFFGYMLWSAGILIPLFIIDTFLFF